MAEITKDIVVRVLGQTQDVEKKLKSTQVVVDALGESFSELGAKGSPMEAKARALQNELVQSSKAAQDFIKSLGSVDVKSQSIEDIAKAYAQVVASAHAAERGVDELNHALERDTGSQIPKLIADTVTLRKELAALRGVGKLGFDIETTSVNLADMKKKNAQGQPEGRARVISLGAAGHTPVVIDLDQMSPSDKKAISDLLSSQVVKIAHNIEFEKKWLEASGINVKGPVSDTLMSARSIWKSLETQRGGDASAFNLPSLTQLKDMDTSQKGPFSLGNLVRTIFQKQLDKEMQGADNWSGAITPRHLKYSAADSVEAVKLDNLFAPVVKELGLEDRVKQLISQVMTKAMHEVETLGLNGGTPHIDAKNVSGNALVELRNMPQRLGHDLEVIDQFAKLLAAEGQELNAVNQMSSRDKWTSMASGHMGQEAGRMELLRGMGAQGIQGMLQGTSALHSSLKNNDAQGAIVAMDQLYASMRKLAATEEYLGPASPFSRSIESFKNVLFKTDSEADKLPVTAQALQEVLPNLRKVLADTFTTLFSPDQLTSFMRAGKLPTNLLRNAAQKMSDDMEEQLFDAMQYDSSKQKVHPMPKDSPWFSGYANSVAPKLSNLGESFHLNMTGDDENVYDKLNASLDKNGIPSVIATSLEEIISHQVNKVTEALRNKSMDGTQKSEAMSGAVENTVNQIAKRIEMLDDYVDNETINTLQHNLTRLKQYKSALQNRVQRAGEDKAGVYGNALHSVEDQIRLMKEAIATTVMSAALEPFAKDDFELQKSITAAMGTMVAPNLTSTRDLIHSRINLPKKHTQKLADGTQVGITDIEHLARLNGVQSDLEALRNLDTQDFDAVKNLRAALIRRSMLMKEMALQVEDPLISKAYKEVGSKITQDLKGLETVYQLLKDQHDQTASLNARKNQVRDSKPITEEIAMKRDSVEKELRLLQGMADIGGVDLTNYRKGLTSDVKSLRELRQKYNTFRSMISGKAPAYEPPMGSSGWEEAGLDEPLQWDKNGMARTGLKAIQEFKTRLLQVYHKMLLGGGESFRPDQIREMIPIAKSAGLDDLYSQAKEAWSTLKGRTPDDQKDIAKLISTQLQLTVENARKLLNEREDLLKVIAGSMTAEALQEKRLNAALAEAGNKLHGVAGGQLFSDLGGSTEVNALLDQLKGLMAESFDAVKFAKDAGTSTGRAGLDNKALKEDLYSIEEELNKSISDAEREVLRARKAEILREMHSRNMSLKGLSDDEVTLNFMRDEMGKLNATNKVATVAADGVKRIMSQEVKSVDDFTKAQLEALNSLLGGTGGVTNLLTQSPLQLKEVLKGFQDKAQGALSEYSRLDSLTRKNPLIAKGALEQQLDDKVKEAQRSWADFAKTVPNDVEKIDDAYKEWMKDNEDLLASIQGLKYKISTLQSGFKPNVGINKGASEEAKSELSELQKINKEIAAAKEKQFKILREDGTGEYANMNPFQRKMEVRKISDNEIKPLEKMKKELADMNKLDGGFDGQGGGGKGRGFIGWLNRIAITAGSLSFMFYGIKSAIGGLITPGLQFSADVERSTIGMASIVASLSLVNGKTADWNTAMSVSSKMVSAIKDKAIMTGQQSGEMLKLTQALLGSGISGGMTQKQIIDFSSVGASALQQIGMEPAQFVQELRDMVQGGIQPQSSVLATSLGVTDADVKRLRTTGQLYDYLMERMKGFKMGITEQMDTVDGRLNLLREGFTRLSAKGLEPLFNGIKFALTAIINQFMDLDKSMSDGKPVFKPGWEEQIKQMAEDMIDLSIAAYNTFNAIRKMGIVQDTFKMIGGACQLIREHLEGITKIIVMWLEWKASSFFFGKVFGIVSDLFLLFTKFPTSLNSIGSAAKMVFATTMVGDIAKAIIKMKELKTAMVEAGVVATVAGGVSGAAGKVKTTAKATTAPYSAAREVGMTVVQAISFAIMTSLGAIKSYIGSAIGSAGTKMRAVIAGVMMMFNVLGPGKIFALVSAISVLGVVIYKYMDELWSWVKDKLKYVGINFDDDDKKFNKDDIPQQEQTVPAATWASLRNKYAAISAEDMQSLRSAEKDYWSAVTQMSVEILKAEIEVEKNQLERIYADHQVTIQEYYDRLYDLKKREMDAEAQLLQQQLNASQQQLSELQKAGQTAASLTSSIKNMGTEAFSVFNSKVTSPFGERESPGGVGSTNHHGIDLGVEEGTPLPALRDGWVSGYETTAESGGYGNKLSITDADGMTYIYAHLMDIPQEIKDALAEQKPVYVNVGDIVAMSGNTGNSTGAHLHLEVHDKEGNAIDPTSYKDAALDQALNNTEYMKSRMQPEQRDTLNRVQALAGTTSLQASSIVNQLKAKQEILTTEGKIKQLQIKMADLSEEKAAMLDKALTDHYMNVLKFYADLNKETRVSTAIETLPGASEAVKNVDLSSYFDKVTASGSFKGAGEKMSQMLGELLNTSFKDVPVELQDTLKLNIANIVKQYAQQWKEAADDPANRELLAKAMKQSFGIQLLESVLSDVKDTLQKRMKEIKNEIASSQIDFRVALSDFRDKADKMDFPNKKNWRDNPMFNQKGQHPLVEETNKFYKEQIAKRYDDERAKAEQPINNIIKSSTSLKSVEDIIGTKEFKKLDSDVQQQAADFYVMQAARATDAAKNFDDLMTNMQGTQTYGSWSSSAQKTANTQVLSDSGADLMKKLKEERDALVQLKDDMPECAESVQSAIDNIDSSMSKLAKSLNDNSIVKILGTTFDKAAVASILTDAFSGFLMQIPAIINGTKSVSSAFRDMAFAVVSAMLQIMVQQFAMHAAGALLGIPVKAAGGQVPARATGGTIPAYASGGMHLNSKPMSYYTSRGNVTAGGKMYGPGTGTSDNLLVAVSPGEWVIRAAAARKYSPAFMKAVNEGKIHPADADTLVPKYQTGGIIKSVADNFKSGVVPTASRKFDGVKALDKSQKNIQNTTNNVSGGTDSRGVTVVNVTDPKMVANYMSSSDGNKTFLNLVNGNKNVLKRILQ